MKKINSPNGIMLFIVLLIYIVIYFIVRIDMLILAFFSAPLIILIATYYNSCSIIFSKNSCTITRYKIIGKEKIFIDYKKLNKIILLQNVRLDDRIIFEYLSRNDKVQISCNFAFIGKNTLSAIKSNFDFSEKNVKIYIGSNRKSLTRII